MTAWFCNQELLDVIERGVVSAIHAGNDVEQEIAFGNEHIQCLAYHLEALFVTTHPVVRLFQAVETDAHRVDARLQESLPTLWCEMKPIGHHSPREPLFVNGPSAYLEIAPHQGFAARDNHKHLVGICLLSNTVEYTQKVFLGHVLVFWKHLTVATAMAASQVAAERALPEELPERVLLAGDCLLSPPELESNGLLE